VLKQKALEKKVANKIKEQKTKEREEKISRRVEHTLTPMESVVQKNVEKKDKALFNNAWFVTTIRAISEIFHNNFKIWLRNDILTTNNSKRTKKEKNASCWTCQPNYNLLLNNER